MKLAVLAGMAVLAVAGGAEATVVGAGPSGFKLEQSARLTAPPEKVWAALIRPGGWWNPEHTYSSNAGNMTIEPVAGGCWCEKWSGGSVEHMTVIYVVPNKVLRMRGGLGPLQELAVIGVMTWKLTANLDGGTTLDLTYNAGGYSVDGLERWARPVDGVLAEQMNRLQTFIQSGNPNAQATH